MLSVIMQITTNITLVLKNAKKVEGFGTFLMQSLVMCFN